MFIQDVKSSNGTFVNGERLSNEGVESEPYELKSEDIVEFGIDIVSEDNKTVVHSKVSAKVYCVWNVEDAGMSSRSLSSTILMTTIMALARRERGLPDIPVVCYPWR